MRGQPASAARRRVTHGFCCRRGYYSKGVFIGGQCGEVRAGVGGKTESGRVKLSRAALSRWIAANTLTPPRMMGRWPQPAASYLASALIQVIAVIAAAAILQVFPTFRFPEALPILAVVLIALTWGAGPGILATLVGVALLDLFILSPSFDVSLAQAEDVAGILLLLVIGLVISAVAGQTARLRQESQSSAQEATARANELEAIFAAMTDGVYVNNARGDLLRTNPAGQFLVPVDQWVAPLQPMATEDAVLELRDEHNLPLTAEQWPLARLLRGEALTGANAVDLRIRTVDGQERDVSVSGAPVRDATGRLVRVVTIVRDMTERRRLERRTHDALDALLAMAEALVQTDDEGGAIGADGVGDGSRATSRVAQRLASLTRSVLGCRRVSITAYDDASGASRPLAVVGVTADEERSWRSGRLGAALRDYLDAQGAQRLQAEGVLILDATPDRPLPYAAQSLLLALMRVGSRVVGVLSLDHDGVAHVYTPDDVALAHAVARLGALIIERERLLGEREEARASATALREANRRMDEFLSIAGHELRTPLTSIGGNTQLLQRRLRRLAADGDLAPHLAPLRDVLDRIAQQNGRMNRLVGDLLDMSRIGSNHLEVRLDSCDLAALVRESVEEQRQAWPARTIMLEAPDGPVPVRGDADRIAQVVTNYVTNALKYSAEDRPVAVRVDVDDATARLSVRDQGPGLSPAQQEHIWDRFHRVSGVDVQSGSGVGLGLGLYISRSLVQRQGGQVGIDSTPGAGSTFWFTLPLTSE